MTRCARSPSPSTSSVPRRSCCSTTPSAGCRPSPTTSSRRSSNTRRGAARSGAPGPSPTSRRTSGSRSRRSNGTRSSPARTRCAASSTTSTPAGCARSADPEDRVVGRDPAELVVRRVGSHPVEELPDLPLPAPQVLAQERRLLVVGQLGGRELLGPAPHQEAALALRPQVAHPLGVPTRRDQVALPLERQQVDRRAPRLPRL